MAYGTLAVSPGGGTSKCTGSPVEGWETQFSKQITGSHGKRAIPAYLPPSWTHRFYLLGMQQHMKVI